MRAIQALLATISVANAFRAPRPVTPWPGDLGATSSTEASKAVDSGAVPVAVQPAWHVSTVNAWKRVLNKSMGKSEFVGSRLQRVARKINPLTECVTDDECAVEIETSAAFFVEPEGGDDKQNEV